MLLANPVSSLMLLHQQFNPIQGGAKSYPFLPAGWTSGYLKLKPYGLQELCNATLDIEVVIAKKRINTNA